MNLSFASGNTKTRDPRAGSHPMIELRGVNKSYRTTSGDYPVLKGIDLQFQAGEFNSIIGKSGSGKTTLLNMITGIDRPTSGEVWVNGSPLHKMSESQMARWRGTNMGIVFQFFQLIPTLSILENLLLAMDFAGTIPSGERKKRALELLDMVELADHANKLPQALSGGQQQRVAIARALANDPPVLIADEPTGNLDSKTAESVFELFTLLARQGKTIIIVTHDNSLAQRTHRTALIADGVMINANIVHALPFLTPEQTLLVSQRIKKEHYAAGEQIVPPDSKDDDLFIVDTGLVEVISQQGQTSDPIIAQYKPGDYFGNLQILPARNYFASARAAKSKPVEIFRLDDQTLDEILRTSKLARETLLGEITQKRQHAMPPARN